MNTQEKRSDDEVIDQLQSACTRVTESVGMMHATVLRNHKVESIVGTAFCVDSRGYFVTALHVVAEQVNSFISMDRLYETEVVAVDLANDLALMHVVQSHPKFLPVHFSTDIALQSIVGGLGYPDRGMLIELCSYLARYAGPVVNGVGPNGLILEGDVLKSALSFAGGNASGGNSGGPLVNANGDVVASVAKGDGELDFIIGPSAAVIVPFVQQNLRTA